MRFTWSMMAAAVAMTVFPAYAERVYTAYEYTVGVEDSEVNFTPAENNLLRLSGARGVFASNSQPGKESTSTEIGTLTDGEIVDDGSYKSHCCTLGDNSVLEWTLPAGEYYRLNELRIYSLWGDNNRNDVSVKSVEVKNPDGTWSTVEGSLFCSSQEKNNYDANTIGEPLVTTHRAVTFGDTDGLLAMGITGIRINFGKQDNGYGGFAEIEALGGVAIQEVGPATIRGMVSQYDFDEALDAHVYTFTASGSTITFPVAYSCTRSEGARSYSFTLLPNEEYEIVLEGEDAVELSCTAVGDDPSAPTPRITGFTGTISGETAAAELELALPWAGEADGEVSLELHWWRRGTADENVVPIAGSFAAGATTSVVVDGLEPRLKYCAQLVATAAGGLVGASDVFTFKVRDPAPETILSTVGASNLWGALEDTQMGLSVNLPGGTWVSGGGWDWSNPSFDGDHFALGEEHACAALPITSVGDYDKPTRLTISGYISHFQGGGGLGFWSEVPLRSKEYVVSEVYDEVGGTNIVTKEKRYYNSRSGYTGLIFEPFNRRLYVFANGAMQGDPATVAVEVGEEKLYYPLTYTVNTADGSIEWVKFNGHLVFGLSSDAFTPANTAYAGAMSNDGGRTSCRDFMLTEGRDMPVDPVLTVASRSNYAVVGDAIDIEVSAINPVTMGSVAVVLDSFDGEGAELVDGHFTWTASEPGVHTFIVSATIGDSTVTDSGVINVYPVPPSLPTDMKPIFKTELAATNTWIKFAGSIQTNAEDCTDLGLVVNLPGAKWVWDSGFDWAPPQVNKDVAEYNLSEEASSVHLALTNTPAFRKPYEFLVQATFTFTGRGGVGFWSERSNKAGVRDAQSHFTGISFNRLDKQIQAFSDGVACSELLTVPFTADMTSFSIRYVANTKTHRITDVVFNGYSIGDFDVPELTDEKTPLFGICSFGNTTGATSRLQFQSLELDGRMTGGMMLIVR